MLLCSVLLPHHPDPVQPGATRLGGDEGKQECSGGENEKMVKVSEQVFRGNFCGRRERRNSCPRNEEQA